MNETSYSGTTLEQQWGINEKKENDMFPTIDNLYKFWSQEDTAKNNPAPKNVKFRIVPPNEARSIILERRYHSLRNGKDFLHPVFPCPRGRTGTKTKCPLCDEAHVRYEKSKASGQKDPAVDYVQQCVDYYAVIVIRSDSYSPQYDNQMMIARLTKTMYKFLKAEYKKDPANIYAGYDINVSISPPTASKSFPTYSNSYFDTTPSFLWGDEANSKVVFEQQPSLKFLEFKEESYLSDAEVATIFNEVVTKDIPTLFGGSQVPMPQFSQQQGYQPVPTFNTQSVQSPMPPMTYTNNVSNVPAPSLNVQGVNTLPPAPPPLPSFQVPVNPPSVSGFALPGLNAGMAMPTMADLNGCQPAAVSNVDVQALFSAPKV